MITPADTVLLPIGLGLLGFVEPCSLGATLVMVKVLEGQGAAGQMAQLGLFTATRAGFIGLAGAMAAVLGTAFLGMQRAGWLLLGGVYVGLGLLFLAGQGPRQNQGDARGPTLRRGHPPGLAGVKVAGGQQGGDQSRRLGPEDAQACACLASSAQGTAQAVVGAAQRQHHGARNRAQKFRGRPVQRAEAVAPPRQQDDRRR